MTMQNALDTPHEFVVSRQDKALVESILAKVSKAGHDGKHEEIRIMSREELAAMLSSDEMDVVNRVYAVDPAVYGFLAPKQAIESVPQQLARVEPQLYAYAGKRSTSLQLLPPEPLEVRTSG